MTIDTITVGRQVRVKIGNNTVCIAGWQPKVTREIVKNADGSICGDMWHPVNRMRKGRRMIAGTMLFDLTGAVLTHLMAYLGLTNPSGAVYNLGATGNLVEFTMLVDMGAAVHSYSNCVVTGWALRGSKGGRPLQLQVNIVAEEETDPGGSAFADAPLTIEDIFAFVDITVSTFDNGAGTDVTLSMDRFLIQVDYGVVVEHNSSVVRTGAKAGEGTAIFATSTPYVSTRKDIYWNYRDSEGPIAGTLTFANADATVQIVMPAGVPITELPPVMGKSDQLRTPVTLDLCRDDDTGTRVAPLTLTIS